MTGYAAGTSVPVHRSRTELEKELGLLGASSFLYGQEAGRAVVAFVAHGYQVRFELPIPDPGAVEFTRTPTGRSRTAAQVRTAWEQACREAWRALVLVVKSKRVAVETGIVSFFDEFSVHIVLPDQSTVGSWLQPQVDRAVAQHTMPALLPGTGRDA